MKRAFVAVAFCALTVAGLSVMPSAATAEPTGTARFVGTPKAVNGARITKYFRGAVAALPVAAENRTGYAREKFVHWNDVDRDCQNARAEVLKSESRIRTTGRCSITRGKWLSYYDQRFIYRATYLDIDHMVPLAESWDSGARAWSAARRQAFANDLTDRRSLVAVTASTNRSKGDRDPAEWLPQYKKCRYAFEWTIVKTRWSLRVDTTEKARLTRLANACPNLRFTTYKAVVKFVGGSTSGGTTDGGSTGTDPRFATCTEAKSHGYGPYYRGTDAEYPWYEDRDNDGVVCE